ncbi:unnamed protein product [Lactuca saligna]|uniref:PARP alpha-helical domain-containing protein n=1 Tax=Lactuca saligna TaxID=75948 RepID=A0AA36E3U0_LACSI|nr:unnamed protein product [Lactuca saligna]
MYRPYRPTLHPLSPFVALLPHPQGNQNQLSFSMPHLYNLIASPPPPSATIHQSPFNSSSIYFTRKICLFFVEGFEVLIELQHLLKEATDRPLKESLIVDANNQFFTIIPSVHPHVIKDEDDFKLKVKMLEALQDIKISSRLVGFHVDNDGSLVDKYKKLQCEMILLPHDSEDY